MSSQNCATTTEVLAAFSRDGVAELTGATMSPVCVYTAEYRSSSLSTHVSAPSSKLRAQARSVSFGLVVSADAGVVVSALTQTSVAANAAKDRFIVNLPILEKLLDPQA